MLQHASEFRYIALDTETTASCEISDARYLRQAEPRLVSLCTLNSLNSEINSGIYLVDFSTLTADEKYQLRDLLKDRDLVVFNGFFVFHG